MKKVDSPKGHRRKSSYDGVLQTNTNQEALQAGFTEQPTYATMLACDFCFNFKQNVPFLQ